MRRAPLSAALSLLSISLFAACEGGPLDDADAPLEPITHTFPAVEVAAYDEQYNQCQSWTLDNEEPLFVNTVEMEAGPGWHHSNWMYVPDDMYPGEDGTWNCSSRDYEEVEAGLAGGVLFAQSTQSLGETQSFPPLHALRIPEHSRVVAAIHMLNASDVPLNSALTLTLIPLAEEDVVTRLRPFVTDYLPLALPPQQQSVFSSTCDVVEPNANAPLDFGIYYVLPHYHGFGTSYFFKATTPAGEITVYDEEHTTGGGEGWGRMFDPPVDLTGATSIEFGCRYNNTTDAPLYFGNGDGEMCTMLAYSSDNRRWAGGVFDGPSLVVGTDGAGVPQFSASCRMLRL